MVIADGIVTHAISVMTVFIRLKVGIPGIKQDQVVMISVSFLVILFRFRNMGLVVGPALFLWFCYLITIGIYNL